MARTSESHPIRVDFIKSDTHPILNQIGVTLAPGKKQSNPLSGEDWNRDVRSDLSRMKEVFGMQKLVSMIEPFEYRELGIEDLPDQCAELSIEHHTHPIVDGSLPSDIATFKLDMEILMADLLEGTRLVIHCKGGLGRAALTAACLIIRASDGEVSPEDAIALVQQARGTSALADRRQRDFVKRFAAEFLQRKKDLEIAMAHIQSDQAELVFLAEQGKVQAGVIRFPVPDGRWFYFTKMVGMTVEGLPEEHNDPEQEFITAPVTTFREAFDGFLFGASVLGFKPLHIHGEYYDEIKNIIDSIFTEMSVEDLAGITKMWGASADFHTWLEREHPQSNGNTGDEDNDWPNGMERTERNFLLYWQIHSIVNSASNHQPLDLISSRQLARVSPGDRIWIVTVDGNGRLLLAGQMKVGEVVDRETAIETIGDSNVWQGELFALPHPSEAPHFVNTVDAHHIAPMLRFEADGASSFNLSDGRLSPNDLQMMREVSFETSSHLYELWANSYPFPEDDEDFDDEFEEEDDSDSGEGIDADMEMFMEMQRMEAEKMIAESNEKLRQNPQDEMALYNLGVAYGMLEDFDKERECYNRLLLINPENVPARFNLGCSFAHAGDLNSAIPELEILVRAQVELPQAYFMLGSILAQQGREEEGIRILREGLRFDDEDGKAYFNIGRALMSLGRFSEAVSEFEKAKSLGFDDIEMCLLLGMCYRETGEKQKELEAYLAGLEFNAMAMDLIFNAGTAWAHIHGGEEGRAIPYKDFDGNFMLNDAPTTFHFGLGLIATGVIDEAKGCVEDLGGPTTELGSKLTRMIRIAESL